MTDLNLRILIDTNLLVYIYDSADLNKQQKALEMVDRLISSHRAILSTQILGEWFSVVTRWKRGRSPLLSQSEAIERLRVYMSVCEILPITTDVIEETLRGISLHSFSYWDAQIWACARVNAIPEIYSEDFATGSTVEGIQFTNPLV